MKLKLFDIENFRGITKLTLDLDATTVLIGENNAGKTTVLEALHACMSRGLNRRASPFSDYDFHLADKDADPSTAPPLVLTMTFEEEKEDEWPDAIDQVFDKAVQILDNGLRRLTFRVTAKYDAGTRDFAVEWSFLDKSGHPLPTAKSPKLVTDLQLLSPVFLLGAVRDASYHFGLKAPFWGPFTKDSEIDEVTREAIEEQIETLNQTILDNHKPFEIVKERIAKAGRLLPLADADLVSVEAVPARILDMLSRTQVKLGCRTGARLPISLHGAGTQSLSVLFLFEAFLHSRLADAYDKHAEPILALEEPESHLHPSATCALWSTISQLAGQKIIATHSGDLLAAVPLHAVRRLARKNGKVEMFRVHAGTLDPRELQKVTYHIRAKRGALMFARCWLLVEGETEFTLFPELARILGYDFNLAGVCCVEFSQCWPVPLIKTAKDLGIEWHLLADGDAAGAKYAKAAKDNRGADPENDRLSHLTDLDIEHCLWNNGYSSYYESEVDANHKGMVKSKPGAPSYPTETIKAAIASTSKPHLSYGVLDAVTKKGAKGVPAQLKATIEKALELAGRLA